MRYSGEYVDTHLQQQYLRARWYNPSSAQFNRLDDFAGSLTEPQSLHKYAYCHGDPVNGIDPSGLHNLTELQAAVALIVVMHMAMWFVSPFIDKELQALGQDLPDALVIGGVVDSSLLAVGGALLGYSGFRELIDLRTILLLSMLASFQGVITGNIGFEIVADFNSAQLAVFWYAGAGISPIPGPMGTDMAATLYFGLVWNCEEISKYQGLFVTLGGGMHGLGGYAGSAYIGASAAYGKRPKGFAVGRRLAALPGGGVSFPYYHYYGHMNLPHIAMVPIAAAYGAIAGGLMSSGMPMVTGISAAALSFLPWLKYNDPFKLDELQTRSNDYL